MTTTSPTNRTETIELSPDYKIPLILVLASIPLLFFLPWVGAALSLFGLFLAIQAATIRLQFTPTALDVYRSGKQIRSFPYSEWQNWRIFWEPVPILFYFKEINSIHFLPIIFAPRALKTCLDNYIPLPGND
jgi:hypothetical protein